MEYLPHILYINLDTRGDRLEDIKNELVQMDISGERVSAVYTAPHGYIGCALSHIKALKLARDRGWDNVLILEDDFKFIVDKEQFKSNIYQFFTKNIEYDVLLLSYNIKHTERVDDLISRTYDTQTTSGYIVNKRFYDKLISNFEEAYDLLIKTHDSTKFAIDIHWKKLQPHSVWYYFNHRIGIQRPNYSDIEEKFVAYNV